MSDSIIASYGISRISRNVYIGNSWDASHRQKGITALLNVAIDLDIEPLADVKYFKVGLIDGPGNDERMLAAAVAVLSSLIKSGHTVLVFCHAGRSRSVTVVSTFLAIANKTSFWDALKHVRSLRSIASPNSFLQKLGETTALLNT